MALRKMAENPVSDTEAEARLSESRKVTAEAALEALLQNRKEVLENIDELKHDIETLERQKREADAERLAMVNRREEAGRALAMFMDDTRAVQKANAERVADLEQKIDDKKQELTRLDSLVLRSMDVSVGLEVEITKNQDSVKRLDDKKKDLTAENRRLGDEVEKKEKAIVAAEEKNKALSDEREVILKRHSDATRDANEKQELVLALAGQIESMRNELSALKENAEAVKTDVSKKKTEAEAVEAGVGEKLKILKMAEDRLAERQAFLGRVIEKAKVDGLIKDFKI